MDKQTIVEITKSSSYRFDVTGPGQTFIFLVNAKKDMNIDISFILNDGGSKVRIFGILINQNNASVAIETRQIHEGKESESTALWKTISFGGSILHMKNQIFIGKYARKTTAHIKTESLLLSPRSHVITMPILEIQTRDTNCGHGATVGTIPPDVLWYMKSRGIGEKEAQRVYSKGFLTSLLSEVEAQEEISEFCGSFFK